MAAPNPDDLSAFMDRHQVDWDQAEAALTIVSAMASAYTRGRGFVDGVPGDDVRAVILSAAARLLTDPGQITERQEMGPFRVAYADHTVSWSTAELSVLNRYRVRAR